MRFSTRVPVAIAVAGLCAAAVVLLVAARSADPAPVAVAGAATQAAVVAPAPAAVADATGDAAGFHYLRGKDLLAPDYGSLPAVGETRTQAGTGARIERIAKGGLVVYSRYTPVSIDNRYIVVHGEDSTSARIVELATGKTVRSLPRIGEQNEIRWHYGMDAPARIYYVEGMQFRQMDVETGKDALVHDFGRDWPGGDQLFTDVEGDSSNDSRYWCWMVRREVDEGPYPVEQLVSYDRVADTVVLADAAKLGRKELGRPNTIEASPNGEACVVHWGDDEGGPQAWKRDFSAKIRNVAVDETHSGWILDEAGDEWFVSQNNRTDWIEAVSLQTGETRRLLYHGDLGWDNGMHFSKAYALRGYVLLSTCSETNAAWGENQLVMLGLDGRILRIAHTHNAYPGDDAYRNEAAAAVSYDGRGIYWTANWGDGNRQRDVYGIELPAQWWKH
ncbi:MAG TPA: hypothetical protein VM619_09190 [Luteimonas sp.]|nr:hypothetical protein [Luteimonas sp.]